MEYNHENHQHLLDELIQLSKYKEIPYTPAQLHKMQYHRLEQVMDEYKTRELDAVNDTIADMLIIKFEDILKSTNMIRQDSKLAKKLVERKIFKRDVKYIVGCITPLLPFMGLIEGVVVASEVVDNYNNSDNKNETENESASSQTEKGDQHNQTPTDESQHDE